jgi:hypothetical protein
VPVFATKVALGEVRFDFTLFQVGELTGLYPAVVSLPGELTNWRSFDLKRGFLDLGLIAVLLAILLDVAIWVKN